MNNSFRYLDKPIYNFPEDKVDNLIAAINAHNPDLLLVLGRTGYARELHYALVNKLPFTNFNSFDLQVEPQPHYYHEDFKNHLDRFISINKKHPKTLLILNTHNKEFIETIYKSNYSYILIRIKEKEGSIKELLLSTPLLSGTEEMNALIDAGLDLRP